MTTPSKSGGLPGGQGAAPGARGSNTGALPAGCFRALARAEILPLLRQAASGEADSQFLTWNMTPPKMTQIGNFPYCFEHKSHSRPVVDSYLAS